MCNEISEMNSRATRRARALGPATMAVMRTGQMTCGSASSAESTPTSLSPSASAVDSALACAFRAASRRALACTGASAAAPAAGNIT